MDISALEADVAAFVGARIPALRSDRCVLAVSGGADSTAMAAVLLEAGITAPDRCVVGHFDHRLRGQEAARADRAAVEALCARYGLELAVETWHAPRPGEAAAREARYAVLGRIADRYGARAIVTGHTADDQAETVLMHAMRGAGLHGLAGMAVDAPHPARADIQVWRPLLGLRREQTRAYCDVRGLAYHDDATNDDRAFVRNRVRLDMLPMLEQRSPGIRRTLASLAEASRAASEAIDAAAFTLVPAVSTGARSVTLDRRRLDGAPADLRPHVFRLAIARLLGDARDFERRHYAILSAAVDAQTGATYALPRGITLRVDARDLHLTRGPVRAPALDPRFERDLPFAGGAGAWHLRILPASEALLRDGGIDLRLPAGATVRARRPGDRVRTRAGGKKLGDWYTDRKIPVRDRDAAPVIAYGAHVLWTPWGALGELPHGRAWRVIAERQPVEGRPISA